MIGVMPETQNFQESGACGVSHQPGSGFNEVEEVVGVNQGVA